MGAETSQHDRLSLLAVRANGRRDDEDGVAEWNRLLAIHGVVLVHDQLGRSDEDIRPGCRRSERNGAKQLYEMG